MRLWAQKNKPKTNPISESQKRFKGAKEKGLRNFFWVLVTGKDIM